ncbi:MAG: GDP-mannose 4,6-dehydratase, partial [Nanoarchaeota archaeon]|nr:GDP-mannose 4,6-dehydratase [Nanoarchaeota archaeon]
KPISLKTLLSKIENALGKKAIIKNRPSAHASVESTCADITKAKKLLGWEPKVSMEEGLKRFVVWFKKERLNNK